LLTLINASIDKQGRPDFRALHFRSDRGEALCIWAFDILYMSNKDLRRLPLVDRKERLERLVSKVDVPCLYSDLFGGTLLVAADRMGLEGIVSKKANMPYRSGTQSEWFKVKCPSWREANKERWRLLQEFIDGSNANPKPFRCVKTADEILASIERFCRRTLQTHAKSE